jgi:hypothetical protein
MNTLLPHELEWFTKLFEYNTKIILNCKPLKVKKIYEGLVEGWNQDKNLVTLLGSLKIEDFRISYPAIIVTPIAIYR